MKLNYELINEKKSWRTCLGLDCKERVFGYKSDRRCWKCSNTLKKSGQI